jgi:hypothetical protein
MKSFEEVKSIYDEEKKGFDVEKEKPEKFLISLELAEPENRVLLSENGINLKPSEWIVLTIDPEILKKTVLRAKELGFLEAYQQTPSFLKQDVDAVIKRMAHLEHLGVPYKSEKGKYQSFLFSKRGYEYVLSQTSGVNKEVQGISDIELKELSDRVIETFAMEDKKNEIYEKLALAEKEGLSIKETLMKVFGEFSDNLDYLSENIDEILANNKEEEKGRVA